MADRIDEIKGRLKKCRASGPLDYAPDHAPGDIAYLLAEVKRLEGAVVVMQESARKSERLAMERESLALSLAEALESQIADEGYSLSDLPETHALRDSRLLKLRGKE